MTSSAELESIRYKKIASQQDIEAPMLSTEPDYAKKHILIVGDNEEPRTFLHACLSDRYRISLAENGEQALKKQRKKCLTLSSAM
ncbi:hypothetical protein [Pinibacter soli]|uniref:Response regulatory domain-containing protein n=1 Tax=Pinibacter soli TaxID=3044211 RepID=A0ABT6RA74_9BACT|nr:hypothetical protein [Pinibacter soli]MDI3319448.1 hypothetical protein [Pinibacter soli]